MSSCRCSCSGSGARAVLRGARGVRRSSGLTPARARRSPDAAAGERGSVRYGDAAIEYEVRRSRKRRKTIQITVRDADANGAPAVVVASPVATPAAELEEIVLRRAAWIVRRAEAAREAAAPRRFADGGTLPYLGRDVPLTVEDASDVEAAEARFDRGRLRVLVPRNRDARSLGEDERGEAVRRALAAWYRERAGLLLPERVADWWPRFGEGDPPRVLVRDQKRRWGSCARDGTLRLNWRCVMLDPELADYVVVHELAHLDVRNHSPAFWRRAASVMPDARSRRARLREAGLTLPL